MENLLRRGYPACLLNKWFRASLEPSPRRNLENSIIAVSKYNPVWEYINLRSLREVFDQYTQGIDLPSNLRGEFLLSLKRDRNMFDIYNVSNLTILEKEASLD